MGRQRKVRDYPTRIAGIDWRNIRKGDRIPVEQVLEAFRLMFPTRKMPEQESLAVEQVKSELEVLRNEMGEPLVFCQRDGHLVALHDAEAVLYTDKQAAAGLRKHKRHTRLMFTAIDVDNLSQSQKDKLSVNQTKNALISSAAEGARKEGIRLIKDGVRLPTLRPPDM